MYSELFRRILATGEEILWRTRNSQSPGDSKERYQCQKCLSSFCGVWNEFRRNIRHKDIPIKHRRQTLREYAEIGHYMRQLQEDDFQNPSRREFNYMRKTVRSLLHFIFKSTAVRNYRT